MSVKLTVKHVPSPASAIGVYVLFHRQQRLAYVGCSYRLGRRWSQWKYDLSLIEVGRKPPRVSDWFFSRADGTLAADWQFRVLKRFPRGTRVATLLDEESIYIRSFYRVSSARCLNVLEHEKGDVLSDAWPGVTGVSPVVDQVSASGRAPGGSES